MTAERQGSMLALELNSVIGRRTDWFSRAKALKKMRGFQLQSTTEPEIPTNLHHSGKATLTGRRGAGHSDLEQTTKVPSAFKSKRRTGTAEFQKEKSLLAAPAMRYKVGKLDGGR